MNGDKTEMVSRLAPWKRHQQTRFCLPAASSNPPIQSTSQLRHYRGNSRGTNYIPYVSAHLQDCSLPTRLITYLQSPHIKARVRQSHHLTGTVTGALAFSDSPQGFDKLLGSDTKHLRRRNSCLAGGTSHYLGSRLRHHHRQLTGHTPAPASIRFFDSVHCVALHCAAKRRSAKLGSWHLWLDSSPEVWVSQESFVTGKPSQSLQRAPQVSLSVLNPNPTLSKSNHLCLSPNFISHPIRRSASVDLRLATSIVRVPLLSLQCQGLSCCFAH
ncbi:hypothetical protein CC79DRAFT_1133063 [Sarocladium strictum]